MDLRERVASIIMGDRDDMDDCRMAADRILSLFTEELAKTVEWEEGCDGEWTCSGCKRDWYIEAGTPAENEYFHCPGCGKLIDNYKPYSLEDD